MSSSSPAPDPAIPDGRSSGGLAPDGGQEGLTYYELLQTPPTATLQQLRQAFRQLSKCYHPDTTTLPAPVAEQAFQKLQRAYAVLSDPQARQLYDERLRLSRLPLPAAGRPAPAAAVLSRSAPVSLRRALSGGEWFALLLLAVALVLSLVLGLGVAWARGAELVRWPSWWADLHPTAIAQDGAAPGQAMPENAPATHAPAP
ncbi:MAG: J domain-containing protein [Cyanobium sp.]